MDVFVTDSSTRRSTRTSPAAISSTARWRSSIRAWSETAKSTRSVRSSPRSTAWPSRSRPTLAQTQSAASSATAAAAAAPIAIQAAVALDTLMPGSSYEYLAGDRKDDRVLGRVVVGDLLAGNRLHLDPDRRL